VHSAIISSPSVDQRLPQPEGRSRYEVRRAGWVELKEGQKICFDIVEDERRGEIIAENLSVAPTEPARASVPVGRKAS
jgi:hypothetical protein